MSGASMTMESVVTRFHYRRLPVSSKTKCIFDGYEMCCKYSDTSAYIIEHFSECQACFEC